MGLKIMTAWMPGLACLHAQDSPKEFEVVSIRVAKEMSVQEYAQRARSLQPVISAGSIRLPFASMKDLLLRAFGVPQAQLFAPEWIQSRYFTIEAKLAEGASQADVPEMSRAMLTNRFGLMFHHDVKATDVLLLAPARGGIKAPMAAASPEPSSTMPVRTNSEMGYHFDVSTTLQGLATLLTQYMRMPVITDGARQPDQSYHFVFDCYPVGKLSEVRAGEHPVTGNFTDNLIIRYADAVAPLGLRLSPAKSQLDNIVVDHLEPVPSEN
jgi:uncharacterized protein (TIGR03435 family)